MTIRETDMLAAQLRAADPIAGADLDAAAIQDALDDIGTAIVQRTRASSRRRLRPRPVVLIAAALLVLGVGGATAAGLFVNAHTGRYPKHAWEVKAGGPGEALNVAGTNFRQVAAQVTADIRFPAGYAAWRSWVFSTVSPEAQTCPGGSTNHCISTVSTGALRGWVAMGAFCAWTVDWRQAMAAGARARAVTDAAVIGSAPRWSAVRAQDPRLFGWMTAYLPAVAAGDRGRVDNLLASGTYGNNCWSADPAFARRIDSLRDPGSAYLTFLDRGRA